MEKVLLWGAGDMYLKRRQLLQFEIYKGNIECVAICSRDHYANYIDGLKVISAEEIRNFAYDWIIVFSDASFGTIKQLIDNKYGVGEKVLDSRIFNIHNFDFKRYISLIKEPITLVTQDCFAAILYNYLRLQFSSPFILTSIENKSEFIKICKDTGYYIGQQIKEIRDADYNMAYSPRGMIGDGERMIHLELFHYKNIRDAQKAWDRRSKRSNLNRILRIVAICTQHDKEMFVGIKSASKIGLTCNIDCIGDGVYYLPRYHWTVANKCASTGYSFWSYIRDMENLSHGIDVLKMLNMEEDFVLEK